mmetsp:Transcript_64861/g.198359  ORF Transcript_64861/g.198359 Transcript_64861/m.198359 type:complete len:202 (-) Transcript_64861:304-909(-)
MGSLTACTSPRKTRRQVRSRRPQPFPTSSSPPCAPQGARKSARGRGPAGATSASLARSSPATASAILARRTACTAGARRNAMSGGASLASASASRARAIRATCCIAFGARTTRHSVMSATWASIWRPTAAGACNALARIAIAPPRAGATVAAPAGASHSTGLATLAGTAARTASARATRDAWVASSASGPRARASSSASGA